MEIKLWGISWKIASSSVSGSCSHREMPAVFFIKESASPPTSDLRTYGPSHAPAPVLTPLAHWLKQVQLLLTKPFVKKTAWIAHIWLGFWAPQLQHHFALIHHPGPYWWTRFCPQQWVMEYKCPRGSPHQLTGPFLFNHNQQPPDLNYMPSFLLSSFCSIVSIPLYQAYVKKFSDY